MFAYLLIPSLLLLLCEPFVLAEFAQDCSNEIMRRCRRNILETLSANGRSQDNEEECRYIRENFDCLLWQTSMCLDKADQDANRDAIMKSWRHMQAFCESKGNWYEKPCYQKKEVTRCESLLPPKGYTTDTASCRSYISFRNCVMPVVQKQCSDSDEKLLGTYLFEKGQQRSWNCPRSYDQSPGVQPTSDRLADVEPRYSLRSESSYGYCADESRYALQECRADFNNDQKEAQTHNDSDMKNHRSCCALVRYENCVGKILEERCGDRGKSEARDIVYEIKLRYPYSCSDHGMNECSAAVVTAAASILNIILTLFLLIFFVKN